MSGKRINLEEKIVSLLDWKNSLTIVSPAELLITKSGAVYTDDFVSKDQYSAMERVLNANPFRIVSILYSELKMTPRVSSELLQELDYVAKEEVNMTPETAYCRVNADRIELVVVGVASAIKLKGSRHVLYASLPYASRPRI